MQLIEGRLRTQGEVTFTSREVGRLADTEPYVLNTALYYALGLASGRYVDTEFEPTYLADTEDVTDVYVSPAAPVSGEAPNFVTTTYNATRDAYAERNYAAEDDPYEKQNLPSYGRRRSLAQGTTLRFFVLPGSRDADELVADLPTYLRLGKKRGKARLDLSVREASVQSGAFRLGHPIGAYDTEQVPLGNVVTKSMKPTPLVMQADYEGEYVALDRESGSDSDRGLPADLTFLNRKR